MNFKIVYNFAAQAGVRYSFKDPESYINSNIIGFSNILNLIKNLELRDFILPRHHRYTVKLVLFQKRKNSKLNTLNIYSLSKLSNEIMAKSFSIKSKAQIIGPRFFSIYGGWEGQIC